MKKLIKLDYRKRDRGEPWWVAMSCFLTLFNKIRVGYGFHHNCHDYFLINITLMSIGKDASWPNQLRLHIYNGLAGEANGFDLYLGYAKYLVDFSRPLRYKQRFRFDWNWGLLAKRFGKAQGGPEGSGHVYYSWPTPTILRWLGGGRFQSVLD